MTCVLCGTRKAKRACPAVGGSICPTCCGTKRLKEIQCPSDCVYLASAQAHPPAVVQRQRERDMPLLVQMIEGLTAAQGEALSRLQAHIRAHRAAAIPPIRDSDVEQAVHALAATLETASRGILYEHQTSSVPALRLQQDLRGVLAELAEQSERERSHGKPPLGPMPMAAVLRRIETIVQRAARQPDATETAFLDFLERIGRPRDAQAGQGQDEDAPASPAAPAPRIIIP